MPLIWNSFIYIVIVRSRANVIYGLFVVYFLPCHCIHLNIKLNLWRLIIWHNKPYIINIDKLPLFQFLVSSTKRLPAVTARIAAPKPKPCTDYQFSERFFLRSKRPKYVQKLTIIIKYQYNNYGRYLNVSQFTKKYKNNEGCLYRCTSISLQVL